MSFLRSFPDRVGGEKKVRIAFDAHRNLKEHVMLNTIANLIPPQAMLVVPLGSIALTGWVIFAAVRFVFDRAAGPAN